MRGGAQAHLLECDDGHFYVVKFRNNPQHRRILINEWIGSAFLHYLQIATPAAAIVNLPAEFLEANPGIHIQLGSRHQPVEPGWHFGSRHPGDPGKIMVYDFLPDALLDRVVNASEFLGVLAFDKWMSNADARQSIFFRARIRQWQPPEGESESGAEADRGAPGTDVIANAPRAGFGAQAPRAGFGAQAPRAGFGAQAPREHFGAQAPREHFGAQAPREHFGAQAPRERLAAQAPRERLAAQAPREGLGAQAPRAGFVAQMMDHGYVFDGPHWKFPDSPLQGLYFRPSVYQKVRGFDDFQPWLDRVVHFPEEVVDAAQKQIPPEWVAEDGEALDAMLEKLMSRRRRVPDLIRDSRHGRVSPFPDWK
jgi:hypothetical protein